MRIITISIELRDDNTHTLNINKDDVKSDNSEENTLYDNVFAWITLKLAEATSECTDDETDNNPEEN